MCHLWARVLGIPTDEIGYKDSFIRLSGHSILAMKLVVASREEGLVLSVADILLRPMFTRLGHDSHRC